MGTNVVAKGMTASNGFENEMLERVYISVCEKHMAEAFATIFLSGIKL